MEREIIPVLLVETCFCCQGDAINPVRLLQEKDEEGEKKRKKKK